MLLCPDCNHFLTSQKVSVGVSGSVEIEHCPFCGGAFFDRFEVNRIPYHQVVRLTRMMPKASLEQISGSNNCPKCPNTLLERLTGEAIPADVFVLKCPKCRGTWFSPKNLEKFKKAQKSKLQYFKTWKIPLPSIHSVLIPLATFTVLTVLTFLSVSRIRESQQALTRAKEIISQPYILPNTERKAVTIIFSTSEPATSEIIFIYAKPLGKITLPASKTATITHQLTLTDLTPGKEYFYQIKVVTAEDSLTSPEFSFTF